MWSREYPLVNVFEKTVRIKNMKVNIKRWNSPIFYIGCKKLSLANTRCDIVVSHVEIELHICNCCKYIRKTEGIL